jgi:Holliday junction resolvasome RuvABC endonuclease subunit
MLILALDLAVTTGFAYGESGTIPRSGVIRLKKPADGPEIAAFNAVCWIRDNIKRGEIMPDLVAVEAYVQPAAHKSSDSIILQYMLHGAVQAFCRCHAIRIESVSAQTVRKHFCGRAHAGERAQTKLMVVRRAQLLKYLPKDCFDDNRGDACALFDWAAAKIAHVPPRELVMFNEARSDGVAA